MIGGAFPILMRPNVNVAVPLISPTSSFRVSNIQVVQNIDSSFKEHNSDFRILREYCCEQLVMSE